MAPSNSNRTLLSSCHSPENGNNRIVNTSPMQTLFLSNNSPALFYRMASANRPHQLDHHCECDWCRRHVRIGHRTLRNRNRRRLYLWIMSHGMSDIVCRRLCSNLKWYQRRCRPIYHRLHTVGCVVDAGLLHKLLAAAFDCIRRSACNGFRSLKRKTRRISTREQNENRRRQSDSPFMFRDIFKSTMLPRCCRSFVACDSGFDWTLSPLMASKQSPTIIWCDCSAMPPSTTPLITIGLWISSLPDSVMPSGPPWTSNRTFMTNWCVPYELTSIGGGNVESKLKCYDRNSEKLLSEFEFRLVIYLCR